ncbi:acetate/propionate family kinase [Zavarzinella formosa]|uniref:acetate/propionate family kinase n=1 Tax=Zavarzinella formosa TaxID=360055 RepID=UPI0002E743EA|nr:acetate/propionate family kinase [Zavarzinella formosa]
MPIDSVNMATGSLVLTVNGGSSSVKFALFEAGTPPVRIRSGAIERRPLSEASHDEEVQGLLEWLGGPNELGRISAIGHRVVHGGPKHVDPQLVTPALMADLKAAIPFAPNHLPSEIRLIEALAARLPNMPHVVCFDTAFHQNLPRVASQLPIPRRYESAGVRRYGFHGLSFAYLLEELERQAGPEEASSKIILAHLGAGSSLAAVKGGRCIDTTMGLTPTGGLMMATRTGDLDPGVLLHLMRTEGLTADRLDALVNRESGLLGVSETTADMRDLVSRSGTDPRAEEAINLYCHSVRKGIGAMAAALGGLDTIVFSGGIGEHSPEIRSRICDGLAFLGIDIGIAANEQNESLLTAHSHCPVMVRVIPTDEESMIARTIFRITAKGQHP